MSIATAIVTQLLATPGVANLIAQRIEPEYDPQASKIYPLAVYKVENVVAQMANDGPTRAESADFVIQTIGTTYDDADAVAKAIQVALNGARGTWSGTVIQGIFLKDDSVSDDVITEPQTEAIVYYTKELAFLVVYET